MDPSSGVRDASMGFVLSYAALFIGGNLGWSFMATYLLNNSHVHIPFFLQCLASIMFIPIGLVLFVATKRSWLPPGHALSVELGSMEDLRKYAVVPVIMTIRVSASLYTWQYNSMAFNAASITMLPVLSMPLEAYFYARMFSRRVILSAVLQAVVGFTLLVLCDSSSKGRIAMLVLVFSLLVEHSVENYLQFEKPIHTSDAAMTLLRNYVTGIVLLPVLCVSGELDVVKTLSAHDLYWCFLATFNVVLIAFGLTGLSGRMCLSDFLGIKTLVQVLSVFGSTLVLHQALSLHTCVLFLIFFVCATLVRVLPEPSKPMVDDEATHSGKYTDDDACSFHSRLSARGRSIQQSFVMSISTSASFCLSQTLEEANSCCVTDVDSA